MSRFINFSKPYFQYLLHKFKKNGISEKNNAQHSECLRGGRPGRQTRLARRLRAAARPARPITQSAAAVTKAISSGGDRKGAGAANTVLYAAVK